MKKTKFIEMGLSIMAAFERAGDAGAAVRSAAVSRPHAGEGPRERRGERATGGGFAGPDG